MLGPNIIANYELGAKLSLADFSGRMASRRDLPRFQQIYRDYDLVIGPTSASRPFPGSSSTSRDERQEARTYYHWMATNTSSPCSSNPALSLPCGLDHKKMPFGLQVIGRFRGDGEVLGAAHAMEQAFKTIPGLARPLPNLNKLRKPVPALKSIVTHPPKLNAKRSKGPAPGAL